MRDWSQAAVQLGVVPSLSARDHIGNRAAKKLGPAANWRPMTGDRTVLVGTLHHYEFFDGSGDERDWNFYVVPRPAFRHLIDQTKKLKKSPIFPGVPGWHTCAVPDGSNRTREEDCMEAEITAPRSLRVGNQWFPDRKDFDNELLSRLECRPIGAYGPWVREDVHGNRPEIHPSDLLWWRDGTSLYLLGTQDASHRFDRADLFTGAAEPGWQAWATAPLRGRFRVAFSKSPQAAPLDWRLERLPSSGVSAPGGQVSPVPRAIDVNGETILLLRDVLPSDGHVGPGPDIDAHIEPGDSCVTSDGTVLGFLSIETTYATGGPEGFVWARLERPEQAPADEVDLAHCRVRSSSDRYLASGVSSPAVSRPDGSSTSVEVESMTPIRSPSGGPLTARFEIRAEAVEAPGVSPAPAAVESVRAVVQGERRALPLTHGPGGTALVKGLAIGSPTTLEVTTSAGPNTVDVPGVALIPVVAASPTEREDDPLAWSAFAAIFGASPTAVAPTGTVWRRMRGYTLTATPYYAPTQAAGGDEAGKTTGVEVLPAEESALSEELNAAASAAIVPGSRRSKTLFATDRPFRTAWTVRATKLTNGDPVPVVIDGSASANAIRVVKHGMNADLELPLSGRGQPLEVVVSVSVRDTLGFRGSREIRLYSHQLQVPAEMVPVGGRVRWVRAVVNSLQEPAAQHEGDESPVDIAVFSASAEAALEDGVLDVSEVCELLRLEGPASSRGPCAAPDLAGD